MFIAKRGSVYMFFLFRIETRIGLNYNFQTTKRFLYSWVVKHQSHAFEHFRVLQKFGD